MIKKGSFQFFAVILIITVLFVVARKIAGDFLYKAIVNSDIKRVEYLIDLGLTPDLERLRIVNGRHKLFSAARRANELVLLKILLAGGMNPNEKAGRNTPLMEAARTGRTRNVEVLISYGANIDAQDKAGMTALMWAVGPGYKETVQTLLRHGADVHKKTLHSDTALMYAAAEGHEEIVDLLVNSGAKINERNDDGGSALLWAIDRGHNDVVRMLHGAVKQELRGKFLFAVSVGRLDVTQNLLSQDVDVDAIEVVWEEGFGYPRFRFPSYTPLIIAATNGLGEIVQVLLDHKAYVDASTQNQTHSSAGLKSGGYTALMMASSNCHGHVVEMLLRQSADVKIRDYCNHTALMMAAKKNCKNVVDQIRSAMLYPPSLNEALLISSGVGNSEEVKALIEKGAEVDTKDPVCASALGNAIGGETPLMYAANNGHKNVVEVLINSGAGINAKDGADSTPLMHAAAGGHLIIVQKLLEYGADKSVENLNRDTALSLAKKRNHEAIAKLLSDSGK